MLLSFFMDIIKSTDTLNQQQPLEIFL